MTAKKYGICKRVIKFRAWDTKTEEMIEPMDFMMSGGWESCILDDFFTIPDYIVMQYTGLKDKNNKEIYEGDVVIAKAENEHAEETKTSYVAMDITDTSWAVIEPGYGHGLSILWGGWESLEVIGNVFENQILINNSPRNRTNQ